MVSIVMPVWNEADHISRSLGAVLRQRVRDWRVEVIVVDGDSTDQTVERARQQIHSGAGTAVHADGVVARILHNPDQIVPISMNMALAEAAGDVIVRVDGHCDIPDEYAQRCLDLLDEHPEADCVGGTVQAVGHSWVARGIAAAQSSRAGVGNAKFRTGATNDCYVDTLAFGAYRREVFDRIGLFDEELVRNQDDELNLRLTQAGGRIWFDPTLVVRYHSRASLKGLWRQYFEYGFYKVRVLQKRAAISSARQLVPVIFVAATVTSLMVGLAKRDLRWPASVLLPYGALTIAAITDVARRDPAGACVVPAALPAMHVGYGSGFLAGIWHWRKGFGSAAGLSTGGVAPCATQC